MTIEYIKGSELPRPEIFWKDPDGAIRDFSTGWTFIARIGQPGAAALVTKSTGIVGSSGAGNTPNLVIQWSANELDIAVATYSVDVQATLTSSGESVTRRFEISILPRVEV